MKEKCTDQYNNNKKHDDSRSNECFETLLTLLVTSKAYMSVQLFIDNHDDMIYHFSEILEINNWFL